MTFEDKFQKQIDEFQRYGTYEYDYDEAGNVVFNSSSANFSQVYLALPVSNFVYNNQKILEFYDPEFKEFLPITNKDNSLDLQTMLDEEKSKNIELSRQLDSFLATLSTDSTNANLLAAKQVILELRKALGQGRTDSDFSEDFPYSPLRKISNIVSESTSEVSSGTQQTNNTQTLNGQSLNNVSSTTNTSTNTGINTNNSAVTTTPTSDSATTTSELSFTPSTFKGGGANKYLQQN